VINVGMFVQNFVHDVYENYGSFRGKFHVK